ncbi:MAG: hypothetical protein ACYDCL_13855 [Myxococcales bacterium]
MAPGFFEGLPPSTSSGWRLLRKAEFRALLVTGLGVLATSGTLVGRSRYAAAAIVAPCVGLLVLMVALMALYLEKWSDRFARLVLLCGAISLVGLGILLTGIASPTRILVGCYAPALLFILGALDLAISRRAAQRSPVP